MTTTIVRAEGVEKSFGPTQVLKGIDLQVSQGEVLCIIGPSGSGKSTFLRCINHLEKIDGGLLSVNDQLVGYRRSGDKLYELKDKEICRERANIGMVFQHFNLFPHMTVLQNVIEGPIQVKGERRSDAVRRGRERLREPGDPGVVRVRAHVRRGRGRSCSAGSVVAPRRDRAGGVERGVDRLGARPVAHHHVDLVVEAPTGHLRHRAAIREALERSPPQLHPRERQELAHAERVTPADHDDGGAVDRHVVGGDQAVGVDRVDAVRSDHEHGARVVGRRLADRLDPRPAVGQDELDPAPADRVTGVRYGHARKREHRQRGSRKHRSRPLESHLGPRILLVSAPRGRGEKPRTRRNSGKPGAPPRSASQTVDPPRIRVWP